MKRQLSSETNTASLDSCAPREPDVNYYEDSRGARRNFGKAMTVFPSLDQARRGESAEGKLFPERVARFPF